MDSRVVSVLDSGTEGHGFKSQPLGNSLRQTVHTDCASVHQAAKLVAVLLPPGLWLTSAAGCLPRTGIGSGTLHSVIDYGLPFLDMDVTYCSVVLSSWELCWSRCSWSSSARSPCFRTSCTSCVVSASAHTTLPSTLEWTGLVSASRPCCAGRWKSPRMNTR